MIHVIPCVRGFLNWQTTSLMSCVDKFGIQSEELLQILWIPAGDHRPTESFSLLQSILRIPHPTTAHPLCFAIRNTTSAITTAPITAPVSIPSDCRRVALFHNFYGFDLAEGCSML